MSITDKIFIIKNMKMNSYALVKALLKQEKKIYKDIIPALQEKTGRTYNPDTFSKRINRGAFTYDEMLALCEILGYEIEIKKI